MACSEISTVAMKMYDVQAAVRKAAISVTQTLFFEWNMDNDEVEEIANAIKVRGGGEEGIKGGISVAVSGYITNGEEAGNGFTLFPIRGITREGTQVRKGGGEGRDVKDGLD